MRFLRQLFTLGLSAKQGLVRRYAVNVEWLHFGSPSRRELERLVSKFFDDEEEINRSVACCIHFGTLFFTRESDAEVFRKKFINLWRDKETRERLDQYIQVHECSPMSFFNGRIHDLSRTVICGGCGRQNPSTFFGGNATKQCRACGSSDLKIIGNMKEKEIRNYVEGQIATGGRGGSIYDEVDAEFDDAEGF